MTADSLTTVISKWHSFHLCHLVPRPFFFFFLTVLFIYLFIYFLLQTRIITYSAFNLLTKRYKKIQYFSRLLTLFTMRCLHYIDKVTLTLLIIQLALLHRLLLQQQQQQQAFITRIKRKKFTLQYNIYRKR